MDGYHLGDSEFYRMAAARVPLAEATYCSFSFLGDADFLSGLYERFRGRCYEVDLSFLTFVNLISEALLTHGGSLNPALAAAKSNKVFEGSAQGVYGKLRRCPQSLSHAFLAEGAKRLTDIMNQPQSQVPPSLQNFEVLVCDGKKIKKVAKRLKLARSFRGSVLGGKVLAALDLETGLIRFLSSDQDGQTNDVPLVKPLLEQMRLYPSQKARLLVWDSQFCDLGIPQLIEAEDASFLIRWSMKTTFERDPNREVNEGVNNEGLSYVEEWGWMGSPKEVRRRYVRRITVIRLNEENVLIFTNLLNEEDYFAVDLMELYLKRWTIENVFQQITEVFHLNHLISSSPCGTIFQFAFCAMMYNQLVLQRSYIVNTPSARPSKPATDAQPVTETDDKPTTKPPPATQKKSVNQQTKATSKRALAKVQQPTVTPEMFSMEKYFKDVVEELIAWNKMIPLDWTRDHFASPQTAEEAKQRLRDLLCGRWETKWLKSPKKKYSPKKEDPPQPGGHTSMYRLMHGDPRTKDV